MMANALSKLVVFSMFLCLLLSQAAAVSALFTAPVKTVAPVTVITNTTTTTTTTNDPTTSTDTSSETVTGVNTTTTTVKTYTYDTSGRIIGTTEEVEDSRIIDKRTVVTNTLEYNNLGQVDKEVIIDQETGVMTDSPSLNTPLAEKAARMEASIPDAMLGIPHGAPSGLPIDLECPETDTYEVGWPDEPYDFSAGDCASIGNEAEVEEYIQELYAIAKECYDSVGANLADMYGERDDILEYLETVQSYDPNAWLEYADPASVRLAPEIPPMLPMFETCSHSSPGPSGSLDDHEGRAYTHLLEAMQEAVNKTCKRANIINDDLVCLCEDVEDYIDGKVWLWPEHKATIIYIFESYGLDDQVVLNSPNSTFNWLLYLNNSWHTYYNPAYIDCSPDIEQLGQYSSHVMRYVDAFRVATGSDVLGQLSVGIDVDEDSFAYQIGGDSPTITVENDSSEVLLFSPGNLYLSSEDIKGVLKDRSGVELRAEKQVKILMKDLTITYFQGKDIDREYVEFQGKDIDGKVMVKARTREAVQLREGRLYLKDGTVPVDVMPSKAAFAAIGGVEGESIDELSVNDHDWEMELVMQGDQPEYLVGVAVPVKLLGFIPANMGSTAHVNARSGEFVSLEYPWWSFLAAR